ncbi:conserved protein of unknown function [Nitrospira japonica]|uniref:Spore protein YkvP/CgeB glycosyl transferase-like domain-containing protein n=2 Tax=Nitrospira japonica TaxID=1325564 RepID=A0A1W1I0D0_9BACT|nr:conserved protein of unknown function [Nitrospira japonica]
MEVNILSTLRRYYCDELHVMHYPGGMGNLGSKAWRTTREELNERLIRLALALKKDGRLDLMFFMVYDDFLLVETARRLAELNVPMVNYHVDMAFQWYRIIRTAPYFHVLAVAQKTNAEHLAFYNSNIEWMPMAANPEFCLEHASSRGYEHGISFVGSFNPFRRALLADCVRHGFKPTVYGRGWNGSSVSPYRFDWDAYKVVHDLWFYAVPRWKAEGAQSLTGALRRKWSRSVAFDELPGPEFRPPCTDEALPAIFRSSKINLGFSDTGWHGNDAVVPSRNLQCRLRDFEVPMAGGFYLVQEAPDHAEYFKPGEEIETWSEPEELIDKLSYYSSNIAAAERIREAGHRRAMSSHTWRHRFDRLFHRVQQRGLLPC